MDYKQLIELDGYINLWEVLPEDKHKRIADQIWKALDEEVHQIWEIVGNALDRNGFVDADGELSIRVYDETLKKNVTNVIDKSLEVN